MEIVVNTTITTNTPWWPPAPWCACPTTEAVFSETLSSLDHHDCSPTEMITRIVSPDDYVEFLSKCCFNRQRHSYKPDHFTTTNFKGHRNDQPSSVIIRIRMNVSFLTY